MAPRGAHGSRGRMARRGGGVKAGVGRRGGRRTGAECALREASTELLPTPARIREVSKVGARIVSSLSLRRNLVRELGGGLRGRMANSTPTIVRDAGLVER
jgi:hypothetical protein